MSWACSLAALLVLPLAAFAFVRKDCSFHWYRVSDAVEYVDQEQLGEHHIFSCKIDRCFNVVKKGSSIIQDGPRDTPAILC